MIRNDDKALFEKAVSDKSQTRTWAGIVVDADTTGRTCRVRVGGGVMTCVVAEGQSVEYGRAVTVARMPGSNLPVVIRSTGIGPTATSVAVPFSPGVVGAHDLFSALHTGTLDDSQAPQFLKLDGSRPMTGALTINIPSGSAPLILNANAQGRLVAGLNADLLDGYEASAFAVAGHSHSHGSLSGLDADDHAQYLNIARHDTTSRHALGTVVPHDDHGALSGLGDDDHPQYPALSHTETITGAWTFQNTLTGRHIRPEATDTYDLGTSVYWWNQAFISQINAVVFAEQTIQLLGGWFIVPKDAGAFAANVASGDTTIDFGKAMTVGHWVVVKAHDTSGAIKTEYIQVGSLVSGTRYNVTRDLANAHGTDPAWSSGTPFMVRGANGDGRIELNAYDTPRLSMIVQGAAYNAQSEYIRIGDLNGMPGYSSPAWGIFIGDASQYLKYSGGALIIAGNGSGLTSINGGNIQTGTITADRLSVSQLSAISANLGSITAGTVTGATIRTAASGARVEMSSTLLAGYSDATTKQFWIDATNGKAYAASGSLWLDSNGANILASTTFSGARSYKIIDPLGNTIGNYFALYDGAYGWHRAYLQSPMISGRSSFVSVLANGAANCSGGIYLGAFGGTGDRECSISIDTSYTNARTITLFGADYVSIAGETYYSQVTDLRVHGGLYIGGTGTDPAAGEIWTTGALRIGTSAAPSSGFLMRIAGGIQPVTDGASDLGESSYKWRDIRLSRDIYVGGSICQSTALGCRVYRSTTQSIPNTTITALSFDTEIHDTDGCWSSANPTKLYAKTAGYYMAGGCWTRLNTENPVASRHWIGVKRNNATFLSANEAHTMANTSVTVVVATGMFYMAVDDYVEIVVWQDTGAARNCSAADSTNHHSNHGWLARIA